MATQESMLSDFSSVLLNEKSDSKQSDRLIVDVSSGDFDTADNRNLSDVLTQIQDNGPADADSIVRDHVHMKTSVTAKVNDVIANEPINNESINKQPEIQQSAKQDSVLFETDGTIDNTGIEDMSPVRNFIKKYLFNARSASIIIVLLVVVAAIIMYKLDLRTRNIEQVVNTYDTEAKKLSSFQDQNLLTEKAQINSALSTLQNNVQMIEDNFLKFSKKHERTIERIISNKTNDNELLSEKVLTLENEILSLRQELRNINISVNSVALEKDKKPVKHPTVKHTVIAKGLVVNLASLTNVDTAKKILKKLSGAGLSPEMESVTIDGKLIFRISVSGFSDEKAARRFIHKAGEQYGLSNGWIRKS